MSEVFIVGEDNIFNGVVGSQDKTLDFYDKKIKALEAKSKAQDIAMRKDYADKIYSLMCLHLFAVFFIIILAGNPSSFKISDSVLITLLGTTTANVIGLFAIVMNYLFQKK